MAKPAKEVPLKRGELYPHKVSIFEDTKGRLVIRRDDTGVFSKDNPEELDKALLKAAKKEKKPIHDFTRYDRDEKAEYSPSLVTGRFHSPVLFVRERPSGGKKGSLMRKIA